jgi:hypothetical protein
MHYLREFPTVLSEHPMKPHKPQDLTLGKVHHLPVPKKPNVLAAQAPSQFNLTFDSALAEFLAKKVAMYPDLMADPKASGVIREIFEAGFVAGMAASALDQFRKGVDPKK